jgi:hypothetical protein
LSFSRNSCPKEACRATVFLGVMCDLRDPLLGVGVRDKKEGGGGGGDSASWSCLEMLQRDCMSASKPDASLEKDRNESDRDRKESDRIGLFGTPSIGIVRSQKSSSSKEAMEESSESLLSESSCKFLLLLPRDRIDSDRWTCEA